jgi:hypothetical protein
MTTMTRNTFKNLQNRVDAVQHGGFFLERSGLTYRDAHKYELCSNHEDHIGTTGCYDTLVEALQDIEQLEKGVSPFNNDKKLTA